MRSLITSSIIVFFLSIPGISQSTAAKIIEDKYTTYFQDFRETIHLHLNKTTFLHGERIWWSAYSYDKKTGLPATLTTNLYCHIYDSKGKQLKKKLFLVENGTAHGSFEVPNEWVSGTYFITAGTAWMNNFDEDLPFIQKITIINQSPSPKTTVTETYDLQILPEGGHIIDGVSNSIGIRIANQHGKGVSIQKAEVINADTQKRVLNFSINSYGVGKFSLPTTAPHLYFVRITLINGNVIEKDLPSIEKKGITLGVNNIHPDKLIVALETNSHTFETIKNQKFYLAIHRDGLMTLNSFSFNDLTKTITIAKNKLRSGTNIITLFNEHLEPISERLIFNYSNLNLADVNVKKPSKRNVDSISLKINIFSKNNTPAFLSATTLPAETIANDPQNTIVSNFWIQPYLRNQIENPARYFEKISRKIMYELDLVLLTQGWSKYNWNTIFDGPKTLVYPFESGVTVQGKITSKVKKQEQLVMYQDNIRNLSFQKIQDGASFSILNNVLQNNDTIGFALKGKNGLRKPTIELDFITSLDSIEELDLESKKNALLTFESVSDSKKEVVPIDFISDSTIALDEVVVEEQKIENKLTRKSALINSNVFTGFKIDQKEINHNPLLTDFISKNGFQLIINSITGDINIINARPGPSAGPVQIYIDDFRISDNSLLFNVPLREIDEVYIEREGLAGDGLNSSGGVIRIYRKNGVELSSNKKGFAELLVSNSFTAPKEFYRPKYSSSSSKDYENYGVIQWNPKLKTNELGEVTFRIPNNGIPNIKIFIEGITSDGALVSHIEEIALD